AELAAELRDDAEAAWVVAALGDLDVGAGAGRGEDARCSVAVKVLGESGGGPVPGGAGEAALPLAEVALGAVGRLAVLDLELRRGFFGAAVLIDGAGGAVDLGLGEDLEGGVVGV